MNSVTQIFLFVLLLVLFSCSGEDTPVPEEKLIPELSASVQSLNFSVEGGSETISINSNTIWTISSSESWCTSSVQSSKANSSVTINVQASYEENVRTATLTVSAASVDDILIQVTQEAYVPDSSELAYIDPDNTGMNSDAFELASKIKLGWNLVNTLEATGGETAWGNPKTSNELIVAVKDAGFNAVRIPCSWNQYIEDQSTYRIKESWMDRVNEVVDYCINNDMYAILNIHWDGGWMENNCTPDKQEEVNTKLAAIWKQVAIRFRDYDEHLLFAGANEPNVDNMQQAEVLQTYMQTFVDVVRATGGRNSYRNLIVQAPSTDIDKADAYMTMPQDVVENRLFAEVHYYSPWNFCGLEEDASWGKMFYFWGEPNHVEGADDRNANWGEEDYLMNQFRKMKSKLVDQGIPVILGEFGAIHRNLSPNTEWQQKHDESRAYFNNTVARESKNNGLIPFCWDNGIFNRDNYTISDSLTYQGLLQGAENGTYPFADN